jgi:DnaJ family protein C protein 2
LEEVEPVGRWFEAYVSRSRKNTSLSNSELDEHCEENNEDSKESSSSSSDSEDERYLLTLDPKEWKVISCHPSFKLDLCVPAVNSSLSL